MIEISITRGEREGKKEILKKATTAFFFLSPVHQFKNNISGKISIQWGDRDQGNPAFFHPSNRLLPSLNFELPPWKRNEHPSSFLLFLCSKKKKNHLATKRVRSRRCSSKRWRRDNFSRYRSFLSIAISADKLLSNDERSDNDFRRASSLSLVSNRDECAQPNRFLTPLKLEWNACVFP